MTSKAKVDIVYIIFKDFNIIDELPLKSISDVDFDKNSLYLATINGCYVLPNVDSTFVLSDWQTR